MRKIRFLLMLAAIVCVCGLAFAHDSGGIFDVSDGEGTVSPTTTAEQEEEPELVEELEAVEEPLEAIEEPEIAEAVQAPEPPEAVTETVQIDYNVTKGDSLWKIAERLLGDGARYCEIIEANKEKYPSLCKNPNVIHPKWVLTIPVKPIHIQPVQTHKIPLEPEIPTPTPVKPVLEAQGVSKPPVKPIHIQPIQTHKIPLEPEIPTPTPVKPILEVQGGNKPSLVVNEELPNLTLKQKISKLQNAVNEANQKLAKKGLRMTELNPDTVRFLIRSGFMSEQEWMAMNPPQGYHYCMRGNRVVIANTRNIPANRLYVEIESLKDSIRIRKQKEQEEKQRNRETVVGEQEPEGKKHGISAKLEEFKQHLKDIREKAKQRKDERKAEKEAKKAEKEAEKLAKKEAKEAEKEAKKAEKEAEKLAKKEAKEAKKAEKEAKKLAKKEAKEAKKAEKEAEKLAKKEAKEAKKAAKEAEKEAKKAEKAKKEAENNERRLAKAANEQYQKFLAANGMKDYSGLKYSKYYATISKGMRLVNSGGLFPKSPFDTLAFNNDIYKLQKQLISAQKHYEKMVDKGRVNGLLGIINQNIQSAGKQVERAKAALKKAYAQFDKAIAETQAKRYNLQSKLNASKKELRDIKRQLNSLDKYNSANAKKLASLIKEQDKCEDSIKDYSNEVKKLTDVLNVFQM